MHQYCRYCSRAVQIEDDDIYCSAREQTYSAGYAKRVNSCKSFDFNRMDVFDPDNRYQPQEHRNPEDYGQTKLF